MLKNVRSASVVEGADGERVDRDHNGARGIYLRALGDIPALRASLSSRAASVASPRLCGNMSRTD